MKIRTGLSERRKTKIKPWIFVEYTFPKTCEECPFEFYDWDEMNYVCSYLYKTTDTYKDSVTDSFRTRERNKKCPLEPIGIEKGGDTDA